MKTNKYLFILLAAGVLVGCGNKTTNTSDEAVKHDTVIVVQQVPDEQPLIDDAEIIAAEANIPDEVEKRDIGTLKSFFTDQGLKEKAISLGHSLYCESGNFKFTPKVMETIKAKMDKIIKADLPFEKRVLTLDEAMNLYEDVVEKNHVVISEYNSKGDETGTFDGKVKGNVYEGTFIRAKDGKRMPFKLTYVDYENDGSFVPPTDM